MNRRLFLQAAVATFALSTAFAKTALEVVHEAKRYVLVGDGVTDNTEAFRAALDGADVRFEDGTPVMAGSTMHLQGGREYVITETIVAPDRTHIDGHGATITMERRQPHIRLAKNRRAIIENLHLTCVEPDTFGKYAAIEIESLGEGDRMVDNVVHSIDLRQNVLTTKYSIEYPTCA